MTQISEQPTDKDKDKILLANNCIFSQQQFLGSKGKEALANEEVSGTVSNVYAAMDDFAAQEKKVLLDEIKELIRFFYKGSPLTGMLDKLIEKHESK